MIGNNYIFKILRISFLPFLFRKIIQKNKITIIVFHNPSVSTFEKAIKYFIKHYNVISLDKYVIACENGLKLQRNSLIITLDDGYAENFQLLNTVKKYQIPITIFVCSELIDTLKQFWWYYIPSNLSQKELINFSNIIREDNFKNNEIYLQKEYSNNSRSSLNIAEINQLNKTQLIDIQSHTKTHPYLIYCDDSTAFAEIDGSKKKLESILQHKIFAIAFPNGDYSMREIAFARKSGYKCCLTTKPGYNKITSNLFELKRLGIDNDAHLDEIIVKSSGLWGVFIVLSKNRAKQIIRTMRIFARELATLPMNG